MAEKQNAGSYFHSGMVLKPSNRQGWRGLTWKSNAAVRLKKRGKGVPHVLVDILLRQYRPVVHTFHDFTILGVIVFITILRSIRMLTVASLVSSSSSDTLQSAGSPLEGLCYVREKRLWYRVLQLKSPSPTRL